jgi:hypothetical protein
MTIVSVRELLQKFQAGYTRRDPTALDGFMQLFVEGGELELIGTNAVETGKDEWCQDQAAVRELVARDWQYWGDVVLDVENAHITVRGEVAWMATTGTVTDTIPAQDKYEGFLAYSAEVLKEENRSAQDKMLAILRLGSDLALSLPLSETCTWPFRWTAVAVRQGGAWRFQQMQFSFATTRAPDVRIK